MILSRSRATSNWCSIIGVAVAVVGGVVVAVGAGGAEDASSVSDVGRQTRQLAGYCDKIIRSLCVSAHGF